MAHLDRTQWGSLCTALISRLTQQARQQLTTREGSYPRTEVHIHPSIHIHIVEQEKEFPQSTSSNSMQACEGYKRDLKSKFSWTNWSGLANNLHPKTDLFKIWNVGSWALGRLRLRLTLANGKSWGPSRSRELLNFFDNFFYNLGKHVFFLIQTNIFAILTNEVYNEDEYILADLGKCQELGPILVTWAAAMPENHQMQMFSKVGIMSRVRWRFQLLETSSGLQQPSIVHVKVISMP